MAQRPERLMATKVYGNENARAKKASDLTKTHVPNLDSIQNGTHANEKCTLYEKNKIMPTGRKTLSSENVQEGKIPIGFVTREEMINRVYNRRSKTTDTKPGKLASTVGEVIRSRPPAGFVTREEMEVRVFIRKMNASNDNQSSLYGNPFTAGNVTEVFSKPKSTPRPIKPTPTPRKCTVVKGNINAPPKHTLNTTHNQTSIVSTERNLRTKCEQDTAGTKSDVENTVISSIANGLVQANDSKRIASSSTVESGIVVTQRSTSTAITRQAKQQPNSSGLNSSHVKILVMNVNGDNDKRGSVPERRRQAIQNIVLKHKPNLVLFQEFSWSGIRGKTWNKHPIPELFEYTGHYDASIMYHSETFTNVQNLTASALDTILRQLQSSSNNRLKRPFPTDFNPISRMCAKIVTTFSQPSLEFICISWHGNSNKKGGGRLKELTKIEYFEYWMEFLRNIREKFNLPILAAGDYNVNMYSVVKFVQSPFKLCTYEGSKRRTDKGIIDFCIITDDLELADTTWVDLQRDTSVEHPNSILDHDPLIATLNASTFGVTGAAMGFGKKKSWPSPIVKMK